MSATAGRTAGEPSPPFARHLRARLVYLRILAREFGASTAVAASTLLAGALLYHAFPDSAETTVDYSEALYRTLMLMTLNFPDEFPRHPVLRGWCFFVPVLSFLVVSEAVVRLALLLSSRDRSGRRWVEAMVAVMDRHVILCGMGRLGLCVLRELRKAGREVVVIERDEGAFGVDEARRLGVPLVIGDARRESMLAELGAARAECVIAATNDDLANLEIALDAREIKPGIRVVMRMFDQALAAKIAKNFDIKMIFSTSALAAPSFAAAVSDRTVVHSFYIDDKLLQTVKLTIDGASPLAGKPLAALAEGRAVFILSHRRPDEPAALFPDAGALLAAGDRVAVLAQGHVVEELHALNRPR